MISAAQIRAARAFLDWKQTDLATASGVSEMSVKNIERGLTDPRLSTLTAIKSALQAAGVEFIDDERGEGVVKLRQPARPAATEAEMQASAADVRSQAVEAVDDALSGSDATDQQKAERRGALTDEPAVIGRARGKGKRP
jgi:transcriptional regulator with XRE-family HTH domain